MSSINTKLGDFIKGLTNSYPQTVKDIKLHNFCLHTSNVKYYSDSDIHSLNFSSSLLFEFVDNNDVMIFRCKYINDSNNHFYYDYEIKIVGTFTDPLILYINDGE